MLSPNVINLLNFRFSWILDFIDIDVVLLLMCPFEETVNQSAGRQCKSYHKIANKPAARRGDSSDGKTLLSRLRETLRDTKYIKALLSKM